MTHNALFVTLATNTDATVYMTNQGWTKLPKINQLPSYVFWYGFNTADDKIGATQDSGFVFASLLLP